MVPKAEVSRLILDRLHECLLAVEKFAVVLALFHAASHGLANIRFEGLDDLRDLSINCSTLAGCLCLVLLLELAGESAEAFELSAAGIDPFSCLVEVALKSALLFISCLEKECEPAIIVHSLVGMAASNVAGLGMIECLRQFVL